MTSPESPASSPEQPKSSDSSTTSNIQTLALTIKDKAVLFAAYMQFVNSGGLFIPTQREFQWGEELHIHLTLMEEPEKFQFSAKVVWITPKGAQGNRAPGIGVQFLGPEGKKVRDKMETYLAGSLQSDRPTHTL